MNYLDVYQSRINHLGHTTAERIRNAGIRSYDKWLAESPHTVRQLHAERGLYFDGIIIRHKDKEYEKIMLLHISNNTDVRIGDIIEWIQDDKTIEHWIVIQEEKKVNGTYRTFWIIRCNYMLRWVDDLGHVQESWSYVVSSVDSKIKGNYRTWHNLISPQPNKYAEIILPAYPIQRSTNFIIEEESWSLIEYDHTSVPGTMYLSLTEGKINSLYDNVPENLADTNNIARYTIDAPQEIQVFTIGDTIEPVFTFMKNGVPMDITKEPIVFVSDDETIAAYQVDPITHVRKMIGLSAGTINLKAQFVNYPNLDNMPELTIQVVAAAEQVFDAYIDGPDKINLTYSATYTLVGLHDLTDAVEFSFDTTALINMLSLKLTPETAKLWCDERATIIINKDKPFECVVQANDDNKLTPDNMPLTLKATYQGKDYYKTISIIPLW